MGRDQLEWTERELKRVGRPSPQRVFAVLDEKGVLPPSMCRYHPMSEADGKNEEDHRLIVGGI